MRGGVPVRDAMLLDLRGTGESAKPADLAGTRVDRQAGDVEALRVELGLEQLDLLAHPGGDLALAYAAAHPERVRSLVLVCARGRSAGIDFPVERRREALEMRRDEPWYDEVAAVFPRGEHVLLAGVGHNPWVDGPEAFVEAVAGFLGGE